MFVANSQCYARHTMRFDVIAIAGDTDNTIEWIQDAFRPSDSTL